MHACKVTPLAPRTPQPSVRLPSLTACRCLGSRIQGLGHLMRIQVPGSKQGELRDVDGQVGGKERRLGWGGESYVVRVPLWDL